MPLLFRFNKNSCREPLPFRIMDSIPIGFLIYVIAPASNSLPQNDAGCTDICQIPEVMFFPSGINQPAKHTAYYASVNSQAAFTNIENIQHVILKLMPFKDHIIQSGTDNGQGNG